jgi:hypothetical protein
MTSTLMSIDFNDFAKELYEAFRESRRSSLPAWVHSDDAIKDRYRMEASLLLAKFNITRRSDK